MEWPVEINTGKVEDTLFFLASLRVAPAVPTVKAKQQKWNKIESENRSEIPLFLNAAWKKKLPPDSIELSWVKQLA